MEAFAHIGVRSDAGDFASRILQVSRRIAPVDEVFSFSMKDEEAPEVLGAASFIGPTAERTTRYSEEFYKYDPLFGRARREDPDALTRRVISADKIMRSDYREICFDRPKLRQKISFDWKSGRERILCNFYLRNPADVAVIADLEAVAAIALPSLRRRSEFGDDRSPLIERLEARLAGAYPELTRREMQVCARTIAGWSAEASALDLGIGAGSVLTYRRRAYARFDYSSAGQFLERILK